MTLLLEDAEIDALAERLMAMLRVDKAEAVRQALRNQVALVEAKSSLIERTREFHERLDKMSDRSKGLPADKAFIDSLYED